MLPEPENLVLKMLVDMREQISALDTKLTLRIHALDTKLSDRMDALDDKLSRRIDGLSLRIDMLEARQLRLERSVSELTDSCDVILKQLRVLLATHDPERLDKIEERVTALERMVR